MIVLDVVAARHRGGFPAKTAQRRWLRRDLRRSRQARGTVAVGHYPIFATPWLHGSSDASLLFALDGETIRGEAVAIGGEIIDAWQQRLNQIA